MTSKLWESLEEYLRLLFFFCLVEIQTKSSRIHPSPERAGDFPANQSHRVSQRCGVEFPGLCYVLDSEHSRHSETLTLTTGPPTPIHLAAAPSWYCTEKRDRKKKPRGDGETMNRLIVWGAWHMGSLLEGQFFTQLLNVNHSFQFFFLVLKMVFLLRKKKKRWWWFVNRFRKAWEPLCAIPVTLS